MTKLCKIDDMFYDEGQSEQGPNGKGQHEPGVITDNIKAEAGVSEVFCLTLKCNRCGNKITAFQKPGDVCSVCNCGLLVDIKEEQDPNGKDQHEPGAKMDDGKVLAGVLGDFGLALMEVAKVGTHGAKKYSRNGWESVHNGIGRYTDAKWRHLLEQNFNEFDDESGLLHLAHECWNNLAALELILRNERRG